MKYKEVQGDLVELAKKGEFDAIVHGCNCQNSMGAGIARIIREVFPEAYEVDTRYHKQMADYNMLGTICVGFAKEVKIINAYTQFYGGKNLP